MILLVVTTGLIGCAYKFTPIFYENTEIALWRLLTFIVGIWYGRKIYHKEAISRDDVILFLTALAFKGLQIVRSFTGWEFLFIFNTRFKNVYYAFPLIIVMTYVLKKIKWERVHTFLQKVGALSLELYLAHVNIRRLLKMVGFHTYIWYVYLLCIAISILWVLIVHKIVKSLPIKQS